MKVMRLSFAVARHEPRTVGLGWGCFIVFLAFPVLVGWLYGQGFHALEDGRTGDVMWIALLIVVCEIGRLGVITAAAILWTQAWVHMQTLLRGNMLAAQVASGGPEAGQPVGSAGEALPHFRDDTEDVAYVVDGMVDVSAGLVFTAGAAFVLGRIDGAATAVLVVPLVLVTLVTRVLDTRIKQYRRADRAATAVVTGSLGDVMAAATTVKVNDAATHALARLRRLIDARRTTAVRDRVLDQALWAFSDGAAEIGLGLVLLVGAGAFASGDLSSGDLAVFVAYLGWLSFLPRMVGRMLARRKQAAVAFERMSALVAGCEVERTVAPRALPIDAPAGRVASPSRPARRRLRSLDVEHLTVRYGGVAVIDDVSFHVSGGSFTVLTGPVGSGKSSLLRALLGQAPFADVTGDVHWNGRLVHDRASFLVPPNAAFLPQVPQLLSDSVADNIAFGDLSREEVLDALELAAVADDVAEMPDGIDTLIGPRGLRLSGGQRQRIATARALVHRPELIVLDDVSSALDVETELQLWERLAATGATVLAVSHRPVAFERADTVLHLDRGRLTDR